MANLANPGNPASTELHNMGMNFGTIFTRDWLQWLQIEDAMPSRSSTIHRTLRAGTYRIAQQQQEEEATGH